MTFSRLFFSPDIVETTLTWIFNEFLLVRDQHCYFVLVLLNAFLACDMVDHGILSDHLRYYCGITDVIMEWLPSKFPDMFSLWHLALIPPLLTL